MKILKLKSILFSLMAIAMVTVFLSSCMEDELIPNIEEYHEKDQNKYDTYQLVDENEIDNQQVNIFSIAPPIGLSAEEAIEWAKNQSLDSFSKSDETNSNIESRYCSSWKTIKIYDQQRVCTCNNIHLGCFEELHRQEKWCFGWSSSCPGNYCVKYYTRDINKCVP